MNVLILVVDEMITEKQINLIKLIEKYDFKNLEEISERAGVSKVAIHKMLRRIEKEGYYIEKVIKIKKSVLPPTTTDD